MNLKVWRETILTMGGEASSKALRQVCLRNSKELRVAVAKRVFGKAEISLGKWAGTGLCRAEGLW